MADLTHHAVEGEGGHNDDGQETALGGPIKKAHDVEKLGLFSESCGFDRMRASSVLGGGSWRSQLVQTPSMHQLTLRNRPLVHSHDHAPRLQIYVQFYWGYLGYDCLVMSWQLIWV